MDTHLSTQNRRPKHKEQVRRQQGHALPKNSEVVVHFRASLACSSAESVCPTTLDTDDNDSAAARTPQCTRTNAEAMTTTSASHHQPPRTRKSSEKYSRAPTGHKAGIPRTVQTSSSELCHKLGAQQKISRTPRHLPRGRAATSVATPTPPTHRQAAR